MALAHRYEMYLAAEPDISLADLCYTANMGRSHFDYRLGLVSSSNRTPPTAIGAVTPGATC